MPRPQVKHLEPVCKRLASTFRAPAGHVSMYGAVQTRMTAILIGAPLALAMAAGGASFHLTRTGSYSDRPEATTSRADDRIRLQSPGSSWSPLIAQEAEEEEEVPPDEVEKYIAVYKAMQHDHSLTVERAAAQQGFTLTQFRTIEDKIERDDLIRERVREALRSKTSASAAVQASPQGLPKGRTGN